MGSSTEFKRRNGAGLLEKRTQHTHKVNAILLSAAIVLLTLLIFGILIFTHSTKPRREMEAQAVEIAQKYADMDKDKVDRFYWFTWNKTYYSVLGTNTDGKKVIAIIPKDGGNVRVVNQSEGYSENKIRALMSANYGNPTVKKVTLGYYKDEPVWEVVAENKDKELTYYLLSFKSGEEVKAVNNI